MRAVAGERWKDRGAPAWPGVAPSFAAGRRCAIPAPRWTVLYASVAATGLLAFLAWNAVPAGLPQRLVEAAGAVAMLAAMRRWLRASRLALASRGDRRDSARLVRPEPEAPGRATSRAAGRPPAPAIMPSAESTSPGPLETGAPRAADIQGESHEHRSDLAARHPAG
jgi:hypothetical protein